MFQDKDTQMIFSAQANKPQDFEAFSFHIENNPWGVLLELIQEFDSLKIFKLNKDKFQIDIGPYTILISQVFDKTKVTLLNIQDVKQGAAELVAKITDLLFYERKRKISLQAQNRSTEAVAWRACEQLGLPLIPTRDQIEHFAALENEKKTAQKLTLGFAQASMQNTPRSTTPPPTPQVR